MVVGLNSNKEQQDAQEFETMFDMVISGELDQKTIEQFKFDFQKYEEIADLEEKLLAAERQKAEFYSSQDSVRLDRAAMRNNIERNVIALRQEVSERRNEANEIIARITTSLLNYIQKYGGEKAQDFVDTLSKETKAKRLINILENACVQATFHNNLKKNSDLLTMEKALNTELVENAGLDNSQTIEENEVEPISLENNEINTDSSGDNIESSSSDEQDQPGGELLAPDASNESMTQGPVAHAVFQDGQHVTPQPSLEQSDSSQTMDGQEQVKIENNASVAVTENLPTTENNYSAEPRQDNSNSDGTQSSDGNNQSSSEMAGNNAEINNDGNTKKNDINKIEEEIDPLEEYRRSLERAVADSKARINENQNEALVQNNQGESTAAAEATVPQMQEVPTQVTEQETANANQVENNISSTSTETKIEQAVAPQATEQKIQEGNNIQNNSETPVIQVVQGELSEQLSNTQLEQPNITQEQRKSWFQRIFGSKKTEDEIMAFASGLEKEQMAQSQEELDKAA